MPFPLAHPAAVLPLRRFCPWPLHLPALVVGSMAPDLAYFLGKFHVDVFAHQFWGSVIFSVPAGLVCLLALYTGRNVLHRSLPLERQPPILRLPWPAPGPVWVLVLSLVVGAWTHFFFDAFTHTTGWFVLRLPWLRFSLATVEGRSIRLCSFLWYFCSFVGTGLVFLAFRGWQRSAIEGVGGRRRVDYWEAFLVAATLVPIEVAHHFLRNWRGMLAVAILTVLLLLVVLWRKPANGASPAQALTGQS